jgi:hypothetical protein
LTSPGQRCNLPPVGLSDRDRAILDFERSWWTAPGPKAASIRDRLHLSPARSYELLSSLVTSSEAASYDPLLVSRLRRRLARQRRARIEGRSALQRPGH